MRAIVSKIRDALSSVFNAIVEYCFAPSEELLERATTLNVLRNQFSAVTSSRYAEAIAPVIEKLSAGDFELKRDLWLVAIGLTARGVAAVDILLEFDNAAYRDDGSVVDLLLYRPL